jgi:hypothetical protein
VERRPVSDEFTDSQCQESEAATPKLKSTNRHADMNIYFTPVQGLGGQAEALLFLPVLLTA